MNKKLREMEVAINHYFNGRKLKSCTWKNGESTYHVRRGD